MRHVLAALVAALWPLAAWAAEPGAVDYNRDIRPLLSNTCYKCHGPDEEQRQAELRLDKQESVFGERASGLATVVPGSSARSELFRRINSEDPDERMPPPDSGKHLTPAQIALVGAWIDQGAKWQQHWSFVKPQRPEPPRVAHEARVRNAIDRFVFKRLEDAGLAPSPEADKETLSRRVTLDLTGLPPTVAEIDEFVTDESPNAYDKLVARLLDSPRFGEHKARYWLDAARYGDTHGLHLDNVRAIWPYRSWVIHAFNHNMPFDQFTIEQIAGDLLPNPRPDQLVATGFNRCNVTTSEGGAIDEEFRVRYAIDRVETMGTVWLGLTVGCAVCHDHKFDPILQKEFYQLFAYFNSAADKGLDGNVSNTPPAIQAPQPDQVDAIARLDKEIADLEARLGELSPETDAAQRAWEEGAAARLKSQWEVLRPISATAAGGTSLRTLEDQSVLAEGTNPDQDTYEIVLRTGQQGITALRLEALRDDSLPGGGPGRAANSNFVLTEIEGEALSQSGAAGDQSAGSQQGAAGPQPLRFVAATADYSQKDFPVEAAIDGHLDARSGWAIDGASPQTDHRAVFLLGEPVGLPDGTELRVRLRFASRFPRHAIGRFRISVSNDAGLLPEVWSPWHAIGLFPADDARAAHDTAFPPEYEVDLAATYLDGKLAWKARPDFDDGKKNRLASNTGASYLYRTIYVAQGRKATLSLGSNDGIKAWLNDQIVLDHDVARTAAPDQERLEVALEPGENRLLLKIVNHSGNSEFYFDEVTDGMRAGLVRYADVLQTDAATRTADQRQQLREFFRRNSSPEWKKLYARLDRLRDQKKQVASQISESLVMRDMPDERETFVLMRGQYDKHGQRVEPGVPAALPPLPEGAPDNRLALARWLVEPAHPLTARVTVNRIWQQYFGAGIVRTPEDFGSQGQWPTHPELLDWLARELVASGWDLKHMHRLIVTSATYRQASRVTPELAQKDPKNLLLARGPRFRMDAEMVRDTALSVSGLLVEKLGGPSVKPYQPPGLWEAVGYTDSNTANFIQDHGDALYRRSLYIFWKRTSPPPTMLAFDAPSRETCTVSRARTNTPLQALVLMNDVQFVEAARHLAERMMREAGPTPEQRITFAYRLATGHKPDAEALGVLVEQYQTHLARYRADGDGARALLSAGESPRDASLDTGELAAWTVVANLILNLDETVTKG